MTSFLIRGLSAFAFAAATLGLGATARAQTFPSKPIRIVVPFAPGGATDILARVLGEKMSPRFGQPHRPVPRRPSCNASPTSCVQPASCPT